ncbi:uncharacterized protein LOC129591041 isoform X2 [Paramacrobiotus metropolitanus]|uniref:uncharacterized protein LOC129591041 isoform X2 n=1 Tax=Paramacrobiotus metropolitanus TaxID=2943436 RepID=UPI002445FC4D|nr:uncharacterized protein LOC129591041 isoform X2 [Paramacrobiotus metropolitanus]
MSSPSGVDAWFVVVCLLVAFTSLTTPPRNDKAPVIAPIPSTVQSHYLADLIKPASLDANAEALSRWWSRQSFSVAFNGEVAVLSPKNPPSAIRRNMGHLGVAVTVGGAAASSQATNASSAFNAQAEALGDLFMDEMYLQSNLEVDEITAVAGFVSKEDLDVQRILWSQDVDLGVSFNWPELAAFPPHKEAAGQTKDPAKAELDPYLVATVLPQPQLRGLSRNNSTNFIDSETGEAMPLSNSVRSLCATGNGTADPLPSQGLNRTGQPFCPPLNASASGNLTALEMDMENRNLQNLIDALNNLNASTLQAIGGREAVVQANAAEDFLQDMQAIISDRPAEQASFLANLTLPFFRERHQNQTGAKSSAEANELAAFNLSSIFMDPPANWSLAMSHLQQQPAKTDTYRFPPNLGVNDSAATQSSASALPPRPRLMTNVCQERVPGSGLVSHVSGAASGGSMLSAAVNQHGATGQARPGAGINHEGPFDFSAFPFQDGEPLLLSDAGFLSAATPMDTLSPNLQQVPQMNGAAFLEHATLFDFGSASSEWNQSSGSSVRVNGLSSMISESSDFNITNLGGFFPAVNSSGNLLPPPMSNASSNVSNDWKMSEQTPGTLPTLHNASAEVLMMLDEAKVRLMMEEAEKLASSPLAGAPPPAAAEDKHVVPEIKQEDLELDPWTEHANFAARHNHSYARHERTLQSRESSEEMGSASAAESSGSTQGRSRGGSVSITGELRSRPNRDDRAASELGLPVSAEEIVNMPVEEFNSLVSGQGAGMGLSLALSQEQIQLMKDIRRRGKNKVAAQNCRRRKIDNMSHLEREIYNLRTELSQATARRDEAARQREVFRAALAGPGPSVIQSSSSQAPHAGGQQHHHASVLVANVHANAQADQSSNKRVARDAASDPLRKRKKDA